MGTRGGGDWSDDPSSDSGSSNTKTLCILGNVECRRLGDAPKLVGLVIQEFCVLYGYW